MASNSYKGITIKFGADTTELGKALRDIDTEAKSVSADIKEIDKGLKIDPKNVDLTVQKINKLGEGIQTASKRLEMLRAAQADAIRAMEDGTAGAEQRYRDLQREIGKTETELARMKQQAKQTSDTMKKELSESIDKFGGQVKKLATTVTAIVGALGGVTAMAANSADEIITLSKVTGISTEELQKFNYASSLIDVSAETLQSSLQRLVRSMNSAKNETGATYEAFRALGIEIKDADGNLRTNTDVFYEIVDALGEIDNVTQRDAYAMQLFGRSAQELNPLIIAGSQALKQYGDEAEQMGLVFDQATLDKLNQFQDKIDISKQQLKGMATIVGGELADSFDALFIGADGLLKKVQEAKEDGTLEEIADGVADAVGLLIDILSSAAKFVYEFRDAIVAGTVALIAYKAVVGISSIIIALTKAVGAFSAAQKIATATQADFNAVSALNPYALIAAAAAAAIIAIVKFRAAQNEAVEAQNRYYDSVVENLHANDETIKKYDELTDSIEKNDKARAESASRINAEYYGYEKLIDELYKLNEEENKGKGTKKRMAEIVNELKNIVPELASAYNVETGELSLQREEIERLTEASKELRLAKAALANQAKLDEDIAEVQLSINMLEPDYEKATEDYRNYKNDTLKKWIEKLPNQFTAGMSYQDILSELKIIKDQDVMGLGAEAVEDERKLRQLNITMAEIKDSYDNAKNKLDELNKKSEEYGKIIDDNREKLDEEAKATEEAGKAAEDAADAVDKLSGAYENAKNKVSSYRSELVSLISTLDKVNSGTKYSTTQILDLLSQYPELANSVHLTSEGYEVEAAAIQKLIDKKADLMLTEAREAEESARNAALKASENYNSAIRSGLANGENLGELGRQVREAQEAWRQAESTVKALEKVTADIKNDNLVQGAAESASKTKEDKTDYWKQAAEEEISEAEHLYKIGEISAEEYYNRLADINRRYYANRAQYLEEYRKLEETVYSGMKKQEEEQLSNMKSLLDRIETVKNAQRELENAQNQKVTVYSSAAGFRTEQNASAIEKASTTLQSKQLELASILQSKYGMDVNVPQIGAAELTSLLPNLSGIRIPTATASQTKEITVNYTAGDVYINGSADSGTVDRLKALMNSESKKFFEEYLSDYLSRADMDRQTGG